MLSTCASTGGAPIFFKAFIIISTRSPYRTHTSLIDYESAPDEKFHGLGIQRPVCKNRMTVDSSSV